MSATTDRERVLNALREVDEVLEVRVGWWRGIDDFRVAVTLTPETRSNAPLTEVAKEYDLRIWYVEFDVQELVLVPEAAFAFEYDDTEVSQS